MAATIRTKYIKNPRIDNFYKIVVGAKAGDVVAQESFRLVTPCSDSVVLSALTAAKNPNYSIQVARMASREWSINSRGYKEYKGLGVGDGDWDTLETLLPQIERLRFEKVEVVEKQKVITYQEVVTTEL